MKKIISLLVLVALLFSFVGQANAGFRTFEQEMEIAKRRQHENRSALSRERNRSHVLKSKYSDNQAHMMDVSKKRNATSIELFRIKNEINDTEKSIDETRNNLAIIGGNIDEKRARVTGLLSFIGEISGKRFIDFVFSATDFSELITRNSTINKLIRGVVVALRELKIESANQFQNQLKLENNEIRLKELKAKQETEQKALMELENKYKQISSAISNEILTNNQKKSQYIQQLKKWDAEVDRIMRAIQERNRRLRMEGDFIRPIGGRISSHYGMRYHPIFKTNRMHTGVDFPARMGAPINSAADGVVAYCAWLGGYGNCVIVNHGVDASGRAFSTLYAHMSRYGTKKGAKVKKGQVIGYIGSTGWSTGPHLHFEVRVNGKHDNPEKYLPKV